MDNNIVSLKQQKIKRLNDIKLKQLAINQINQFEEALLSISRDVKQVNVLFVHLDKVRKQIIADLSKIDE
jgi:hypothetical protein